MNSDCQNIPAEYAGLKSPYAFNDQAVLTAGKQIYDNQCAICHGSQGEGDGPGAAQLDPKPANFTDPAFMQSFPIDCNFYRISEGVKGTNMLAWKTLGEQDIWKVLIYERSFSEKQ